MSRLLLGTPGFALIVAIQVELFPTNILVHSTDIAYCSRTGFVVKLIDVFKLRMIKLLS